jgi:cyclic pyranopterin phosphate synthase
VFYACLFATGGTELRAVLRGGVDDDVLADLMRSTWTGRMKRYSEIRAAAVHLG